jgi:tryptophan synthase alpha subunit
MDFIFMLTHADKTVENCLEVIDFISESGVQHIGFKDVGVDRATQKALVEGIRAIGATSYFEVVSTTNEDARASIRTAAELGLDRVLGGQEVAYGLETLKGSAAGYFPFPGKPMGHPTRLAGSPEDIAADCRRIRAAGCAGADLLAYRTTEADPVELVRAARGALGDGYLIVAGSIDSPARVRAMAEAGVDGFTIGSAVFNGSFSPGKESILSQLKDILAASGAPP